MAEETIRIGLYEPGDEQGIVECFNKVFGCDRKLEHWNWKFRDCPYGLHAFLGKIEREGQHNQIVAQFTGIPSDHKVGDQQFQFCQILDSMVDPDHRKGLKKPGLFASTVFDYVEYYGREDREAIMYGLPNPQAFRIGRRLLGYSFIHDIVMLYKTAETMNASPIAAPEGITVETVDRFGDAADEMWKVRAENLSVANIRDAKWMDWRYADCPDVDYAQFVARDGTGAVRGIAVARAEYIGTQDAVLCDWLVRPDDEDASVALLAAVEGTANSVNATGLQILFPEYAPEFAFIHGQGYEKRESQFIQVARSYTDKVPLDLLKTDWWYTLGDYDLV